MMSGSMIGVARADVDSGARVGRDPVRLTSANRASQLGVVEVADTPPVALSRTVLAAFSPVTDATTDTAAAHSSAAAARASAAATRSVSASAAVRAAAAVARSLRSSATAASASLAARTSLLSISAAAATRSLLICSKPTRASAPVPATRGRPVVGVCGGWITSS